MLYYENLDEIVFNRHQMFRSDELVVISGYIGPDPFLRLAELPLQSSVIYGLFQQHGINRVFHQTLVNFSRNNQNSSVYYSNIPVHSKCYIWKINTEIVHVLIGSANFSTNGLTTPYREVLAEATSDTFGALDNYLQLIINNSVICSEVEIEETEQTPLVEQPENPQVCRMTLLDSRTRETHRGGGLNWGFANAHVKPNDAYIPIGINLIRQYPNLFPEKQEFPIENDEGTQHEHHHDGIDIVWDDGITMTGRMEGSQIIEGRTYPKQIASIPEKELLGKYFRRRLGVGDGEFVETGVLTNYGRTHIDVSLLGEGIYYFDFSV